MKTTFRLSLLISLFFLTACGDGGALSSLSGNKDKTEQAKAPPVAGEEYVNLDGTPVKAGEVLGDSTTASTDTPPQTEVQEPASVEYTATQAEAQPPADGDEYLMNMQEVKLAVDTGEPGRLLAVPQGFAMGYPIYPASCIFANNDVHCTLDSGKVVTEQYVADHTTVIRNSDVMELNITCGIVCVDANNVVLGHVSKEMLAWREDNCSVLEYGSYRCNW